MAKNTIELKGKSASAFFKADVKSIKPDSERLEAAGFVLSNSKNGVSIWILPNDERSVVWCETGHGYGITSVVNPSSDDVQIIPNVKTVDDVLTLARLLGLSKEVE